MRQVVSVVLFGALSACVVGGTRPADDPGSMDGELADAGGPVIDGAVEATAPEPLTIAVLSDLNGAYGSTTYDGRVHSAVDRVVALRPDLVLSTGDMVAGQQSGLDYLAMWQGFHSAVSDKLQGAGIPFAVTPGNHDASGYPAFADERATYRGQWMARKPAVTMIDDEGYPFNYAFSVGSAMFVSLDSTTVGALSASQMAWLSGLLSEHRSSYDAVVVFGHVPLYGFAQGRESEIIGDSKLESLLVAHDVDLFISGHHHAYYPGHREELRLVSTACLGGGPRKLIGSDATSDRSVIVFTILGDSITDLEAYGGAGLDQPISRDTLPAWVGAGDQVIVRDDL